MYKLLGDTGRRIDCLQKIHKLADGLVIGFAGSVKLGFDALDLVKERLDKKPHLEFSNSERMYDWFRRAFRRVFEDPKNEKQKVLGVEYLICHKQICAQSLHGIRTAIVAFKSKEFSPEECPDNGLISVGKSNHLVKAVESRIINLKNDLNLLITSIIGMNRFSSDLSVELRKDLRQRPIIGVSEYLMSAILDSNVTRIQKANLITDRAYGREEHSYEPETVADYGSFLEISKKLSASAECAIC